MYGMLSVYEYNSNNNYIILLRSYNYKGLCKLHAQMVDYFSKCVELKMLDYEPI